MNHATLLCNSRFGGQLFYDPLENHVCCFECFKGLLTSMKAFHTKAFVRFVMRISIEKEKPFSIQSATEKSWVDFLSGSTKATSSRTLNSFSLSNSLSLLLLTLIASAVKSDFLALASPVPL